MRAPDFLLSAFFSIHGAAGSPAHAPGLRRKCPPRSLRITSSSRLIKCDLFRNNITFPIYPNVQRYYSGIHQRNCTRNIVSRVMIIEFMPLLLHRISPPIRFGLCAHSTHPRAGCQTRAKKQSLTQSVRPRKVGSAPDGLTACYRLTAHKKSITCSGTWI